MEPLIRVGEADFDVGVEVQRVLAMADTIGGVVNFVGVMRSNNDGRAVEAMHLEHYPGMTEKALAAIAQQASERWSLEAITVIHRVGLFKPGDQIVLVVTAASHRGEAFQACEFIMDFLKTRAPFWKKEITAQGEFWVDARSSDDSAADRWQST
ncbi:molybdopterin synthase catalytic subunit MoaE [Litorivivens sp.]|uniref:molybdopterin synthase catalytic subunit MoaE n=1 Tax=Litorivivens sp. TaxID=2020868 RepID=UPI003568DBE6